MELSTRSPSVGSTEIVLSAKAEDPDVAILGLVDRSG